MSEQYNRNKLVKERNYTSFILIFSFVLVSIIALLFFLPGYDGHLDFDVTIFPLLNAIFNCFTFIVLVLALVAIKKETFRCIKALLWQPLDRQRFF